MGDYYQTKKFLFTQGFIVPLISLRWLDFALAIFVSNFFKKKVFNELNSIEDL